MGFTTARPDGSELQTVANGVAQIESEFGHIEQGFRSVVRDLTFLENEGATAELAASRLKLARCALRLADLTARLQGLLAGIRETAGQKALEQAQKPIQFQR